MRVDLRVGEAERTFWLSVPAGYSADRPSSLIFVFSGRGWTGRPMQQYMALEEVEPRADEIFVYPDPLERDFGPWGVVHGWQLGPHAGPATGNEDLVFVEAILHFMAQRYCIEPTHVFATGHSWGGDMANVVACFLGDRFAASVPIASNRPYWFRPDDGSTVECTGETALWIMFGIADAHFSEQASTAQFGDEQRDFWTSERTCEGKPSPLPVENAPDDACVEYTGCSAPVRYCRYDASVGHQRPPYSPRATMEFFRSAGSPTAGD